MKVGDGRSDVGGSRSRAGLRARRALLRLTPLALAARLLPAQLEPGIPAPPHHEQDFDRLPNGKSRLDAQAKVDYDQNIKDARELIDIAKSFEEDLEKDDRFVLSLTSLKKLDEIEKLTKRIRTRLKHQ